MKKQKFTYRILAITMCICMICSIMPMAVHAEEPTTYYVSVNSANPWGELSGMGYYAPGDTVTISANPYDGYHFYTWAIAQGSITLADEDSQTTTFIMPEENVTITANLREHKYIVSVDNEDGTHSGSCLFCDVKGDPQPHTPGDYEADGENGHYANCTECNYQTSVEAHVYDDSADTDCNVCGYIREAHTHTWEWTYDSSLHWQVCGDPNCGESSTAAQAHQFDSDTDTTCDCGYTRTVEHTHEWGDWESNDDGTHTRTCTADESHTETETCAEYAIAQVDEHNHNILCECFSGENYYVLGTEAHTMSEWVRDGEFDRRECTKHCDYYEEREHTHDWSNYTYKGNGVHTRNCTAEGCTSQQSESCGGRATCHELAFCPDCKTTYGEYDQKNHSGGTEVRNAKKATETENGYTGDTYCLGCETLLNEGSIIYATGSGDDDDDTHTHNYSYYNYDGTNHWKMCHCGQGQAGSVKPHSLIITGASTGHFEECTVCEYYSDVEDHVYTDDSDAFCNECGYRRHVHEYSFAATCTSPAMCSCRATTGDKDPTNHTGGTEIRNAKEATETEKGYTGDTYCRGCGAKLASGKYTERLGFVEVKYDDDVVVKEVTFRPIKGVDISDDAEVIVKDHTATIEPVAAIVGSDVEIEYITVADSDIIVSDPPVVLNGVTYYSGEIIVINGEEFLVVANHGHWLSVYRLSDGAKFEFDGKNLKNSTLYDIKVEKRENQKLNINGVTYDVVAVRDGISELDVSILYYKGKPAGQYRSETGVAVFNEGYDPATLKAQRGDIFIGSVTVPEKDKGLKTRAELVAELEAAQQAYDEYVHEHHYLSPALAMAKIKAEQALAEYDAIAQLAAKKRYNVYEIGANEISIKNATAVSGTITQTFEVPAEFVGNENVKFIAVHDTNPYADALAEALAKQVENFTMEGAQEYLDIKALYDEWEATNGRGTQFGEISLFGDGKTLIATYEVDSFSPFIVYAFVETDEPEIKTLSATIVDGSDDTTEAPDTSEPVVSPQTSDSWIWYVLIAVVAGAIAVVSVVYGKRRKSKAN